MSRDENPALSSSLVKRSKRFRSLNTSGLSFILIQQVH